MVMQMPSRPVSLLLVCQSRNEGNLLRLSIEESLGDLLSRIELKNDVKEAFDYYKEMHSDVVLICGFESGFSEALTMSIRRLDGKRHTGIIVMAPVDENVDQTVSNNYQAGADDVISINTSLSILKSKMITVINHKIAADELRTAIHKLAVMSITDDLTGLSNMRGFLSKFSQSVERCASGSTGIALLMIDLDHFKTINDSMNHLVGSHVIKSVGAIIRQNGFLAKNDFAARYGGDEYIVLFHGTDVSELRNKAEAIRSSICETEFRHQKFVAKVTCSIGMCFVPAKSAVTGEEIIKLADAMLYRSKDNGRNLVSSMTLGDSINLDHIGGSNLVNRDSSSDNDSVARFNHAKAL